MRTEKWFPGDVAEQPGLVLFACTPGRVKICKYANRERSLLSEKCRFARNKPRVPGLHSPPGPQRSATCLWPPGPPQGAAVTSRHGSQEGRPSSPGPPEDVSTSSRRRRGPLRLCRPSRPVSPAPVPGAVAQQSPPPGSPPGTLLCDPASPLLGFAPASGVAGDVLFTSARTWGRAFRPLCGSSCSGARTGLGGSRRRAHLPGRRQARQRGRWGRGGPSARSQRRVPSPPFSGLGVGAGVTAGTHRPPVRHARAQPAGSAANRLHPPKSRAKALASRPSGKRPGCAVTAWDQRAPCVVQLTALGVPPGEWSPCDTAGPGRRVGVGARDAPSGPEVRTLKTPSPAQLPLRRSWDFRT